MAVAATASEATSTSSPLEPEPGLGQRSAPTRNRRIGGPLTEQLETGS
jgi:hypothetical protein